MKESMPNIIWFLLELSYSPTQVNYNVPLFESLLQPKKEAEMVNLTDFDGDHWKMESFECQDSSEESFTMESLSIDDISSAPSNESFIDNVSPSPKNSLLLKEWKLCQFWNESQLIPKKFKFNSRDSCTLSKS
jgi:hypothetical protein